MKRISVKASQNYDVLIGTDLLNNTGEHIAQIHNSGKAAIISDSNVWPLYGSTVQSSLEKAGFKCSSYVFPAGEASKNTGTYLNILNFLAESQVTRSDLIIALGGGVVGDITGFAAATFLRGVSYVQIPTSLLAMVDSSVGGKTAIDLPAGKNLVGAFKQPSLVLCDVSTLTTLPSEQFLDGCAEIIKYGMLYDFDLFTYLLEAGPAFDQESVIAKCITYKRDVVLEDEFDTGARQKLNLGHTLGHGIETGSSFKITHGRAVSAGMAVITKACAQMGICTQHTYTTLVMLLKKFSLPTETEMDASVLYASALSDKKRSGTVVNLIVPKRIGECQIYPIPIQELESFIKAGL